MCKFWLFMAGANMNQAITEAQQGRGWAVLVLCVVSGALLWMVSIDPTNKRAS
jgi:hypothetical protein